MNASSLLNGLELLYPDNTVISQMKRTLVNHPECEDNLVDAFSLGQLKSKLWLIENLPTDLGKVFICAGWYGTLASFMFDKSREKFDVIRSFDIDPTCANIAETMNKPYVIEGWQFKASTMDIHAMEYPTSYTTHKSNGEAKVITEMPDTIINTSCEHIKDFDRWYNKITKGVMVILQSNNFFEVAEHVNCVNSYEEFESKTPIEHPFYGGHLELDKYTRFMRIGIK